MMAATTVSAGAAASGYYKAEGYYLEGSKEAEASASWFGKGAEEIGLKGQVDDGLFSSMLEGQTYEKGPEGLVEGRVMGRWVNGERQHRPGIDLTFSAPKDVSVAALVFGDGRLVAAHDAAVKEALSYVEQYALQTRRRKNGELVVETGGKMIAGVFRHDTSRAMDPQLHSHAVVANMVRNTAGDYTAVHNDLIFKAQKLGSEIYRASLAKSANELGYTVERYGKDRLIGLAEVSSELSDQFSKRRADIESALEERGEKVDAKSSERAALATRASKEKGIDRAELVKSWRDEAKSIGIDAKDIEQTISGLRTKAATRVPGQTRDGDAASPGMKAVDLAVAHLSENATRFGVKQVVEFALRFGEGVDLKSVTTALQHAQSNKVLVRAGSRDANDAMVTTEELIIKEKEIVQELRAAKGNRGLIRGVTMSEGRPRSAEGALVRKIGRTKDLSEGQRDAIVTALTGSEKIVGIQGSAGTGKTYMLERLKKYATENGLHVEGLAPSNRAVEEMSGALPDAETVQARLMRGRPKMQGDDAPAPEKTILIVDESSMLSNAQMLGLQRQARAQGIGRVVFMGDTAQLDGVAAGTPFALLQKSGMRTAVMDDVVRQRDDILREAVGHAIAGEVAAAFDKLSGKVSEHSDVAEGAAKAYLALSPEARAKSGILTPSNRTRIDINTEVREGLKAEGAIGEEDHTMDALQPMRFSAAERGDAKSYKEGDVIVAHQSVKSAGITKGHIYEVVAQTNTTLTLQREGHDNQFEVKPAQGSKLVKSLEVYERTEREMSIGEAVKFRISDKSEDVTNGMRGTVKEISDIEVQVELEDGSDRTMDRNSLAVKGMDQAHALTAHDMQGASVGHPIMALSSGEHFANLKSFYVGVSRSVDSFELVTDNAEKLQARVTEQTGEVPTALEAYIEGAKERGSMVHKPRETDHENDRNQDRPEDDKTRDKNTPDDGTEREAPALPDEREKERNPDREKSPETVETIEELKQKLADEMKQFDQRVRQEKTR